MDDTALAEKPSSEQVMAEEPEASPDNENETQSLDQVENAEDTLEADLKSFDDPRDQEPSGQVDDSDIQPTDETSDDDGSPAAEAEEEIDLDSLPDTPDWRKFRKAYDKGKETIRALEAKVSAAEETKDRYFELDLSNPMGVKTPQSLQDPNVATAPMPPVAEQVQAPVTPQAEQTVTVEYALTTMAQIHNGEVEPGYKPQAQQVIDQASSEEILQVLNNAEKGNYGEDSSEYIAGIATRALAKANVTHQGRLLEQQQRQAVFQERQDSVAKVTAMEGMRDVNSDQYKQYESMVWEIEKSLPEYWKRFPRAPEFIMNLVNLKNEAGNAGDNKALKAEVSKLRKQLEKIKGPSAPSQPAEGQGSAKSHEAIMEDDLSAAGF